MYMYTCLFHITEIGFCTDTYCSVVLTCTVFCNVRSINFKDDDDDDDDDDWLQDQLGIQSQLLMQRIADEQQLRRLHQQQQSDVQKQSAELKELQRRQQQQQRQRTVDQWRQRIELRHREQVARRQQAVKWAQMQNQRRYGSALLPMQSSVAGRRV